MSKILFLVATLFSVQLWAAQYIGNGGGILKSENGYISIGSSGKSVAGKLWKSPTGLNLAKQAIANIFKDSYNQSVLLMALSDESKRKYYSMDFSLLPEREIERLKEHYARVINAPKEQIVIAALTFPHTKETYLANEFNQLNEIEQAALLFHEALWLLNPYGEYREVIRLEVAFQNILEGQDGSDYMEFINAVSSYIKRADVALREALLRMQGVSYDRFVSQNYTQCLRRPVEEYYQKLLITRHCSELLKSEYFLAAEWQTPLAMVVKYFYSKSWGFVVHSARRKVLFADLQKCTVSSAVWSGRTAVTLYGTCAGSSQQHRMLDITLSSF